MNAHTPGPWVVGNGGNPHGAEFEVRSADENDIYITGVQWANPGDPEEGYMPSFAQARANAVLIAAAPDGLALASLIVALTGNVDHSRGGGENTARLYGGMLNDIRDAAHKFIARATASVGGAGA